MLQPVVVDLEPEHLEEAAGYGFSNAGFLAG